MLEGGAEKECSSFDGKKGGRSMEGDDGGGRLRGRKAFFKEGPKKEEGKLELSRESRGQGRRQPSQLGVQKEDLSRNEEGSLIKPRKRRREKRVVTKLNASGKPRGEKSARNCRGREEHRPSRIRRGNEVAFHRGEGEGSRNKKLSKMEGKKTLFPSKEKRAGAMP